MKKTDKMLFRMINNSKGQFAAVVTIIVVGVAVFIALSMSAMNLEITANDYYDRYDFADLHVIADNIPAQKIKDIELIEGVKTAEGRIVLEAPVITGNARDRLNVRLISSRGEDDEINRSMLIDGRFHKAGSREGVVLGQLAEARGISRGDKIKIQSDGADYTIEITGVVANPEFVYLMENAQAIMPNPDKFGIIYISEAFGRQISGSTGANEVLITYLDGADEESIISSVENQLRNYGLRQIVKRKDQLSNSVVQMEIDSISNMSASVPFLFIAVAALVLIMMLGRMVKRDRIKIGILKGLGYTNKNIIAHYTKYAVTAGAFGGVIGAALGLLSAGALTRVFLEYFNIPLLRVGLYPSAVITIIITTCIFCVISGIIGSRGIMSISPADSMKTESPRMGKRILLERLPAIWRNFTFSQKLVLKNVFRNKKRGSLILIGIALSYAMMLFTTSMSGAVEGMINDHYREFQKMNFTIGFKAPVKQSALNDLRSLIDVEYMEGKLEYPFEFENGNRKQTVGIIGLPGDTEFYGFKRVGGESVSLPKTGVLISENLANNLNLKAGDTVKLNTFIPGRNSVYVTVKDVITQTLGLNAYMDIGHMGEKLMEKNAVNGVYLNSKDDKIYEKLANVPLISSVMSVDETRSVFEEYMSVMNASMAFMVIFSGIMGFCIVYNATSITIGERETEFSALRVLGFSGNEIFKMILNENNLLMLAGIALGVPLGLSLLSVMSTIYNTDIYTFNMTASPQAVVMAAGLTALFVFFAQFATYQKIKRLDLMAALKNRMN